MGSSDHALKPEPDTEGREPSSGGTRKNDRPSMRPGGPSALLGTVLSGRYRIEKVIGEGGMAVVYQAEHTHMRKRLAIKVLHPEMTRLPEVVQRFEREAMAAAHIDHPNVAGATDFGKLEDGSFFLVLEFVEGSTLREEIAKGPMELGRALHISTQIAAALERAHKLGIVHRDLKPENIKLIERNEDTNFVKVLDFGIAKVPVGEFTGEREKNAPPGTALTQLGMVYGTPEYMAPEQALGQPVDARADLYALGVMAYEMICGMRPFDHESKVTLLGMHVTAPVPPMREKAPKVNVPPEVEGIIVKLLAKDATNRYADAKELIDALLTTSAALVGDGVIAGLPIMPTSIRGAPSLRDVPMRSHVALDPGPPSAATGRPGQLASLGDEAALSATHAFPRRSLDRRVLAIAGSAVGVLAFGVIAFMVVSNAAKGARPAEEVEGGVASPSSATAELPPLSPSDEEIVYNANVDVEKGDFGSAIEILTPLEKRAPGRPDVHRALEKAYTGARRPLEAMHEADLWIQTDGSAVNDLKLEEDVRNAALTADGGDVAFALLEGRMGEVGADVLYDIAYGDYTKQHYRAAAARATASLDKSAVRAHASAGLLVTLDFIHAQGCDEKHALLDRAREDGDRRTLAVIKPYTAMCRSFLRSHPCYPCMYKDQALPQAVQAIEARTKK
jgi:eukaryotic-like serine/threonine-protein kinase